MDNREVMIGNFAIARGLVEAGVELAAAYPGTPSSEILPGIVEFKRREGRQIHTEWSVNERCAFEVAYGAAFQGKKAVCMMKQVGLNVAFPALMEAKEKEMEGALVVVSCDDPGPQSSQTEQDTRLLAVLFGIPVFDPASPVEAGDVAYYALRYSYEHKTPVILRSTHRVSHAREAVPLCVPGTRQVTLDEGIKAKMGRRLGVVASGMSCSVAMDVISELGLEKDLSFLKVIQIFPLQVPLQGFVDSVDKVLVLEETDRVLEAMIGVGDKVFGRSTGYVPDAGELTYDVVRDLMLRITREMGMEAKDFQADGAVEKAMEGQRVQPRPPTLCSGCPHRASFYAMKKAFPEALFPGDIGCYTLGIAMGAVDTCLDMGAGVTLAAGFYDTFHQDGIDVPILASVGDSTFFHACLSPLYDAVKKEKKFILVLMDNATTAMTGLQPTPQSGVTADGTLSRGIPIEDILAGFGIEFMRIVDPYDIPLMIGTIYEAKDYLGGEKSVPAVIIARRECLLYLKGKPVDKARTINLETDCIGCKACTHLFDCPAMVFDEERKKLSIDERLCTQCGVCLYACTVTGEGKMLKKLLSARSPKKGAAPGK